MGEEFNIGFVFDAQDKSQAEFNAVINKLKDIERLEERQHEKALQQSRERIAEIRREGQEDSNRSREAVADKRQEQAAATAKSREVVAGIRREGQADTNRSREAVADTRKEQAAATAKSRESVAGIRQEQQADTNRSREAVAATRREQQADTNRSREAVAGIRQEQAAESIRSREKITNINTETQRMRLYGQEASRIIQKQRLDEQRLAREQRNRHFELRRQQRGVLGGFNSWGGALQIVTGIISGELLFALDRFARRTLEVTKTFESLRLGFGTFEGSQAIADQQIARIRELARLPSVGFEGGIRSVLQLRSAGFDFETSERLLKEISNQVALSGKSTDELNRALYQFIQTGGLQEFRTEELRQIFEIVPQMRQVFEEVFGTFSGEGVQNAMKDLGITFDEALDRLLTKLEERPRAPVDTLTNKLENLTDEWADLQRLIGEQLTPVLKALIDALTITIPQIPNYFEKIQYVFTGGFLRDAIDTIRSGAGIFTEGGPDPDAFRKTMERHKKFIEMWFPEEASERIIKEHATLSSTWFTTITEHLDRMKNYQAEFDNLTPRMKEAISTTHNLWKQVQEFNRTGNISAEAIEQLAKGSNDLLAPTRKLLEQNQQRLDDLNDEIKFRNMFDEIGNKAVQQRIANLQKEADLLRRSNEGLEEFLKTREKAMKMTQEEFKQAARRRLRERETPDFSVSPDDALPGPLQPGRKFYDDNVRKILTDANKGRPIIPTLNILGLEIPLAFRPIATRREGQVGPTIDPTQSALFPRFDPTFRNILPPNVGQINQEMLNRIYSSPFLHTPTVPRRVSPLDESSMIPTADLNIALPQRDLLDPRRWEILSKESRNLLDEWKDLRVEAERVRKSIELKGGLLDPSQLGFARDTADEYSQMLNKFGQLSKEILALDKTPPKIANAVAVAGSNMSRATEQLRKEIDKLNLAIARTEESMLFFRQRRIDERVKLSNEDYNELLFGQPTPPSRQQAEAELNKALRPQRRTQRQQQISREQQLARYFEGSTESLYDQFVAPSILDFVGIGSGQSAARDRSLDELKRSIDQAQKDVRENSRLNATQQAEELLEINREYEREKREIERAYEEERSDAWKDWVRQQLTDFPKLIFQQLNLQLAARATNEVLRSLGLGGNIPIQGGGLLSGNNIGGGNGLFSQLGRLFGQASATQQYASPIGPGLPGSPTSAVGLGSTAATAGVALSAILAGHNIVTGTVPGLNPHRQSLFDDFGGDLLAATGIPTFFEGLHFNNPLNDQFANMLGRQRSQDMLYNLGRQSAQDLATEYDKGRAQAAQQQGTNMNNMMVIDKNHPVNINIEIDTLGERQVKKIKWTMDELITTGRLGGYK